MQNDVLQGLIWYGVFLFSVVCHEASHAWTALKLGDDSAERSGQVSLNPWPHIRREPIGMVLLPLLSWALARWMIGWASVPLDQKWARRFPRRAAITAMAGPAANLIIATLSLLLLKLGLQAGVFIEAGAFERAQLASGLGTSALWEVAANVLSVAVILNFLLCLINLFPIPPLDGASIPLFFLKDDSARRYLHATRETKLVYAGLLVIPWLISPLFKGLTKFATGLLY